METSSCQTTLLISRRRATRKILGCLGKVASVAAVLMCSTVNARADFIVVSTTIQAAVDAARPGDTVLVLPGIYRENVVVRKDNITILARQGAVMDGSGLSGSTGIRVTSGDPATRINGFVLSGLVIQNYSRNGVVLLGVDNFEITNGEYINNDQYGIFPILSSNGLIENSRVSQSNDTGIYVGLSTDVVVRKNQSSFCTIGIQVENSSRIKVEDNRARDNTVGILVVVLPGLDVKVTSGVNVVNNVLSRNNRPDPVTNPEDILFALPSGIGLLNLGGDRVMVKDNTITQNNSAGIAVVGLPRALASLDPRIDPSPDNNEVRDNLVFLNGRSPDQKIAPLPGRDLLWDGSGTGNCWAGNTAGTSFPPRLPACP